MSQESSSHVIPAPKVPRDFWRQLALQLLLERYAFMEGEERWLSKRGIERDIDHWSPSLDGGTACLTGGWGWEGAPESQDWGTLHKKKSVCVCVHAYI